MAGFRGGAVMEYGCRRQPLGVAAVYLLTGDASDPDSVSWRKLPCSFAKAGGGFTKTADISADLTGKVEIGIPERTNSGKSCGNRG